MQLRDPLSTFQAVLQAMVLGFTPLFGQISLPEVDLRLASHVLTWIYERHAEDIQGFLEKMNVIEVLQSYYQPPYSFNSVSNVSHHMPIHRNR